MSRRSEVAALIESVCAERELEWESTGEASYAVTLPGTHKLKTICNLIVGEHALRVEAFVMRQPDERREELWAWLLQRNARMYGVSFSIDAVGDVYLTGRVNLAGVDADELDRLLGSVLTYADESFDSMLEIGFGTRHPPGVGVAGQARRVDGQPGRVRAPLRAVRHCRIARRRFGALLTGMPPRAVRSIGTHRGPRTDCRGACPMAQRNSSGRGTTATRTKRQTGNQTPNTPRVSESAISRMKVDDIRSQLKRRGVSGISALRKPELVKTLARTMRRGGRRRAAQLRPGRPGRRDPQEHRREEDHRPPGHVAGQVRAGRARHRARAKATGTRKAAPPAQGHLVRGRPRARAKAAPSRAKAAAGPARARRRLRRRAKAAPSAPRRRRPAKATSARAQSAPTRGPASSRSIGSSQLITSLADRPERPGRSLVTRNHEVIQRWARARGAKPATIAGTERGGRPGVLTFNMPGYRESSRIREITWDDWFRTFDLRRLNLIYQEQMRDGRQSNFFRTENPNREDG